MKAIVMAGGEGTRLRPVTSGRPKPMAELLGRPVLAYTVELLKKYGIEDICFTLKYMPQAIEDYFGNGNAFGVRIESRVEETPLGTAGSVRACRDFIGDEDVLVISGDAVCDFDIGRCVDFHRQRQSETTLVLYEHQEPTEYGLVVTDGEGRILRFIEKPRWDMVTTDLINTGIYILSPSAVDMIPDGTAFDFGKELFPRMLNEGRELWGVKAEGYWCDIGSPEAYRRCCVQVASGNTRLFIDAKERKTGVWSKEPLPDGVEIKPPVYIGKNCSIAPGASIGPETVLSEGCRIMDGASISGSVINGATVQGGAKVSDAIVGRGAKVGRGAQVCEGCVIGDGALLGDWCTIAPGVRVWTERQVPDGARLAEDLIGEVRKNRPIFYGNKITGEMVNSLTPELAMSFGGVLGRTGRTGASWYGGEAARLMAAAFGCGVTGAGGEYYELDCSFETQLALAAAEFALDRALFIRQEGDRISMEFLGEKGSELPDHLQRKLGKISSGEYQRAAGQDVGPIYRITGSDRAYIARIVRMARGYGISGESGIAQAEVAGCGAENRMLRRVLRGFDTVPQSGTAPSLTVDKGGRGLCARDEMGVSVPQEKMQAVAAAAAVMLGEKRVALERRMPSAIGEMIRSMGAQISQEYVDRDYGELREKQIFMRDGIAAAVLILGAAASNGSGLSDICRMIPKFATASLRVELPWPRARAMRELSSQHSSMVWEPGGGLRGETPLGKASVAPSIDGNALLIRGEAADAETAQELIGSVEKMIKELKE